MGESSVSPAVSFLRKAICWWLPVLYLLISDAFYLRTYDSAQVKITLLQMGGISLLGMWASLLILEGKKAFAKTDFVLFAPFLAYLAYIVFSFAHAPYKGPSLDDFVRYILYMSITLIVIREFTPKDVNRVTKILIITAYIAVLYGLVQFLDTRFFPPKGMGPGLDPFVWRWAFQKRVFSTYGNPNFFGNFLVLILPVAVAQFLKKRSVYLIPLIVLDLLCLYATETKGAWLGFAISFFIFCVFYGYYFLRERLRIGRLRFLLLSAVIPVLAFAAVVFYAYMRPSSVSFRVATWLSTWEIIETHPLEGVGVGSFKIIYPAYRRPVIFHIEGRHNTETDHAEEEHLEQVMDNGLIGGGIYFWLIVFTAVLGLRGLERYTSKKEGGNYSPAAYDLLGYLTAFLAMLIHNCTDVSMRFVSSGIFLGLLPGLIVNLSSGRALWELHYLKDFAEKNISAGHAVPRISRGPSVAGTKSVLSVFSLLLLFAALSVFIYLIFTQFSELQGALRSASTGGETLLWFIAWICFIAVSAFGVYVFAVAGYKSRSAAVPLVLALTLCPVYYFWGWFRGDVNHNWAIFFSKSGRWEEALSHYREVNRLNKFFIMPYYFTANVFNDRFDMTLRYSPESGDENQQPSTDFDRAMKYYKKVLSLAPNYVQTHYQLGNLYLKRVMYELKQGNKDEAKKYEDLALASYDRYENLDPVFEANYLRKAEIYMNRQDFAAAELEMRHSIDAWKCHQKDHKHESFAAYFALGNALYFQNKLSEAEGMYKKALEFKPGDEKAEHNLEVTLKLAAAESKRKK